MRGELDKLDPVVLTDHQGAVAFHPLPYAEPTFFRALPGAQAITDHLRAMSHMVGLLRGQRRPVRQPVAA